MIQQSQTVSQPPEEERASLTVFPAYLFPVDSELEHWELVVEGLLTRPGKEGIRSRWSVSMLAAVMGVSRGELDTPIFRERSAPFLASGVKRKSISVMVGDEKFLLPRRTNGAGIFRGRVKLDLQQVCRAAGLESRVFLDSIVQTPAQKIRVPISVIPSVEDVSEVEQMASVISPAGVSIVSDIDDTIKDSQVAPLRALLTNTFLKKFRSVQGMAKVYQGWEQSGASFHYVSSSPWQLFHPLMQLCENDDFPCGTFHLRAFRLGRDLVQKMLIFRRRGKYVVIRSLLKHLPERKFILVGDSGEKDPEIYSKLASKFPDQVLGIYIRNTEHKPLTEKRLQKLATKYKSTPCHAFDSAEQLEEFASRVLSSVSS